MQRVTIKKETQMAKRTWKTPRLTALARGGTPEAVLETCKFAPAGPAAVDESCRLSDGLGCNVCETIASS